MIHKLRFTDRTASHWLIKKVRWNIYCWVYLLSKSALSVKPEVPHVHSWISKKIRLHFHSRLSRHATHFVNLILYLYELWQKCADFSIRPFSFVLKFTHRQHDLGHVGPISCRLVGKFKEKKNLWNLFGNWHLMIFFGSVISTCT